MPLFEKAGTGLRLNEQGKALATVAESAFITLQQGWLRLMADARTPSIHVACSATFAMRWLVPHLPGFYRQHADVRVRLSMTSAREIRHQDADLLLAWDRRTYPARDQALAIELAPVSFGPVCAPGYQISSKGRRLRFATLIAHEFTSQAWDGWRAVSGFQVASEEELTFPHTHLCIEAATSGLGVALVEKRMVADDIRNKRLVAPVGFTALPEKLAAVPASGRPLNDAARAFITWLSRELAQG